MEHKLSKQEITTLELLVKKRTEAEEAYAEAVQAIDAYADLMGVGHGIPKEGGYAFDGRQDGVWLKAMPLQDEGEATIMDVSAEEIAE